MIRITTLDEACRREQLARRIRAGGARYRFEVDGTLAACETFLKELDLLLGDRYAKLITQLRAKLIDLRVDAKLLLPALDEVLDDRYRPRRGRHRRQPVAMDR
jgi:hypothetical protein